MCFKRNFPKNSKWKLPKQKKEQWDIQILLRSSLAFFRMNGEETKVFGIIFVLHVR